MNNVILLNIYSAEEKINFILDVSCFPITFAFFYFVHFVNCNDTCFVVSLPSISISHVLKMPGSPEIVLVSYSSFKSNPPNEFRQNKTGTDNLRLPDSAQVTIISDKQELSNTPKTSPEKANRHAQLKRDT